MAKIQPGFLSHQVVNFTWIPVSWKRFLPGRTENPGKKDLGTPWLKPRVQEPRLRRPKALLKSKGRRAAVAQSVGSLDFKAEGCRFEPQPGQMEGEVPSNLHAKSKQRYQATLHGKTHGRCPEPPNGPVATCTAILRGKSEISSVCQGTRPRWACFQEPSVATTL